MKLHKIDVYRAQIKKQWLLIDEKFHFVKPVDNVTYFETCNQSAILFQLNILEKSQYVPKVKFQAINKESWRQQHCKSISLQFKEKHVEKKFLEVKETAVLIQICCYLLVFVIACAILTIGQMG